MSLLFLLWLAGVGIFRQRQSRELGWLQQCNLPTLCVDGRGAVVASNGTAERLLDLTQRSLAGEELAKLMEPLEKDEPWPAEQLVAWICDSPNRLYRSSRFPDAVFRLERTVDSGGLTGLQLIDETERMRLLESQRMFFQLSTKSRLIASAMHEIGSPLAAIEGGLEYSQVLLADAEANSEVAEVSSVVVRLLEEIKRVNQIKVDFVGLFRDEEEEIELHDLNAVVERACTLMNYDKRMKMVEVRLELDRSISALAFNEGKLLQVLLNLLTNAADALVECHWQDRRRITAATCNRGDTIELVIEDNGIGMSEDVLKNSFDQYFTTKERGSSGVGSGSGLGLMICRNLVREMGGDLHIESRLHKGTRVVLSLKSVSMNEMNGWEQDEVSDCVGC
ncbi:HAMP domain-containing histidine kinase [Ferrimonas sediminicola]|uniref:histidine kinase n=1 Tax=Ferrimonas sediminicola TaxID=2569538 RepID=A0A4U1BBK6_9GAMM|nr:HAMP domain-containing sensor histidine kinase [Ferrimonas sediminicola]TKB48281.1 HAMP domain-containing histidine kinase [Ferrimonas sediminicola]